MKTHRLLLAMFMGALAVLATLAALGQSRAVADVPHEWSGHWYWKDGGWPDYAPSGVPDFDQKQDCWGIGGCPAPGIPGGAILPAFIRSWSSQDPYGVTR